MLGQPAAFSHAERRGFFRQRLRRLPERRADMLHKRRAALLIFLIQTLGLLKFLIHHHLTVLIANNKNLRSWRNLTAELTDFIQFIVHRRLDHALMLIGHINDVLQVQMRQQMIGDRIADHRTVSLQIVQQQRQ